MLAEIKENGTLVLKAGFGLEAFALKAWLKSYQNNEGCSIVIISEKGEEILKQDEGLGIALPPPTVTESVVVQPEKRKRSNNAQVNDAKVLKAISELEGSITVKGLAKSMDMATNTVLNSVQRLYKKKLIARRENSSPQLWYYVGAHKMDLGKKREFTDLERVEFAKSLGYGTIDEALKDLGSWDFEDRIQKWVK